VTAFYSIRIDVVAILLNNISKVTDKVILSVAHAQLLRIVNFLAKKREKFH